MKSVSDLSDKACFTPCSNETIQNGMCECMWLDMEPTYDAKNTKEELFNKILDLSNSGDLENAIKSMDEEFAEKILNELKDN